MPVFAVDIPVAAGSNLQTALNNAKPGDTVTIAAGASFVGHFVLPANPGPQTIIIQSSAMSSLLKPPVCDRNEILAAMP